MLNDDLKRCPFCDALSRTMVRVVEMGDKTVIEFGVRCTECGTTKRAFLTFKEEACFMDVLEAMDKAEKLWNTRAGEPAKEEDDARSEKSD